LSTGARYLEAKLAAYYLSRLAAILVEYLEAKLAAYYLSTLAAMLVECLDTREQDALPFQTSQLP
jgi:hypothetical protein